ncbi:MAG: hypothetical protein ACR2G6_09625 [Gemmatimonadaceae bacterium]
MRELALLAGPMRDTVESYLETDLRYPSSPGRLTALEAHRSLPAFAPGVPLRMTLRDGRLV